MPNRPTRGDGAGRSDRAQRDERLAPGGAAPLPRRTVRLRAAQRAGAEQAWSAASALLEAGAQGASPVLRNELLRAVHSCRVAGLHRLAAAGQRVAQQLTDLHDRRPEFRLASLTSDVHQLLSVAHAIRSGQNDIDRRWVGEARRGYAAVDAMHLHGLFTEAVTTASGYAGVVTTLLDPDTNTLWSLGDVTPGDVSRCKFSYVEHFRLGDADLQHRELGRNGVRLEHATASANRRLGSGRGVTAEAIEGSAWWQPPLDELWAEPLEAQLQRIWSVRSEDERHAGDDLLFLRATLLGAETDNLLLKSSGSLLSGVAPSMHAELAYRHNLELLGRAVGLEVWLIGRAALAQPRTVQLLAAGGRELRVPEEWRGRVNLALDRLTPVHLPAAAGTQDADLPARGEPPIDPLAPLERRLEQVLLGGRAVLSAGAGSGFARDERQLQQSQLPTAAALLTRLRQADNGELADAWLAARIYLAAAQGKLQREGWLA